MTFRLERRAGEGLAAWNARNAAFLHAINDRKRVFLSSTLLPGPDGDIFTLRVCILSFRTHAASDRPGPGGRGGGGVRSG